MRYLTPLFVLFIALGFSNQSLAQPGDASRREKIEQLKIAYITKELDLTTEEAKLFWPAYNEMDDALKAEKKKRRQLANELKSDYENLSEEDAKSKAHKIMDSEKKEAELRKEHFDKIAAIVGYKKTIKLLTVEQEFKKELLRKVRENRQGTTN